MSDTVWTRVTRGAFVCTAVTFIMAVLALTSCAVLFPPRHPSLATQVAAWCTVRAAMLYGAPEARERVRTDGKRDGITVTFTADSMRCEARRVMWSP